jgi:hypothetical protein
MEAFWLMLAKVKLRWLLQAEHVARSMGLSGGVDNSTVAC